MRRCRARHATDGRTSSHTVGRVSKSKVSRGPKRGNQCLSDPLSDTTKPLLEEQMHIVDVLGHHLLRRVVAMRWWQHLIVERVVAPLMRTRREGILLVGYPHPRAARAVIKALDECASGGVRVPEEICSHIGCNGCNGCNGRGNLPPQGDMCRFRVCGRSVAWMIVQ